MKKILYSMLSIIIIMVLLPVIAVFTVRSDMGMAVMIILLFTVNPLFSVMLGIIAGGDFKRMWYIPFLSSVVFLAGVWCIFDTNMDFLVYAVIYFAAGYISAFLTMYVNKLIIKYYKKDL